MEYYFGYERKFSSSEHMHGKRYVMTLKLYYKKRKNAPEDESSLIIAVSM